MIAPALRSAPVLMATWLCLLSSAYADIITFNNTTPIAIRDRNVANPFPSALSVTGVPFLPLRLTVTVTGVSHTYINDVAMALVSPSGIKTLLVSGTGPEGGQPGPFDISGQTWTFDDYASAQMPQSVLPTSGAYKPGMRLDDYQDDFLQFGIADTFDTNFNRMVNADPTGDWLLLVRDSQVVDFGSISGGWSISFYDTVTAVPEPSTIMLSLLALGGTGLVAKRRKKQSQKQSS